MFSKEVEENESKKCSVLFISERLKLNIKFKMPSNRLRKCLICNDGTKDLITQVKFFKIPNFEDISVTSIEGELSTLFVVRNLLGISSTFCQDLISCNGNPSSWGISYCSDCAQLIQEAQMIFRRIRELVDNFDELKENLKDVMWASLAGVEFLSPSKKCKKRYNPQKGMVADKLRQQFHNEVKKTTRLTPNINRRETEPTGEPLEFVIKSEPEDSISEDDESYYVNEADFSEALVQDFSSSCPIYKKDIECDDCGTKFRQNSELKCHVRQCQQSKNSKNNDAVENFEMEDTEIKQTNAKTEGMKRSLRPRKQSDTVNSKLECASESEPEDSTPDWEPKPRVDKNHCKKNVAILTKGSKNRPMKHSHMKSVHANTIAVDVTSSVENGNETTTGSYFETISNSNPEVFKCKICQLRFISMPSIKSHVQKYHTNGKLGSLPYACTQCNLKFSSKVAIKRHIYREHHSKPEPINCEDCGRTFKKLMNFNSHRRDCQSKSVEKRPFMCEICSKSFSMQRYLNEHQQGSHYEQLGLDPYKCSDCGKVLNSSRNLDHHMKMVHLKNGYLFQCDKCPRGFMFNIELQNHIRICHTREKTFKCPQCPKTFSTKAYLGKHMITHSTVKPWNCPTCSKAFSDSSTYKRHLESHGLTVHECPRCGKTFKVRHAFRLHMKSHSKSNAAGSRRKPRRKVVGTTDAESSQQLSQRQPQEDVTDSSLVLRPAVQAVTMEVENCIPSNIVTNTSTIQSSDIMSSSVNNNDVRFANQ